MTIQEKNEKLALFDGFKHYNDAIEEYPLFESFEHSKNGDLKCSIGLYGGFSIVELHWCNKTPEREFSTINNELTIDDYHTIIRLLNVRM